ncbi:MAG: copper chaperone PCu(A)C [Gammaproteobacteria bacterium]|nr:copper chaperone PCu(A)C [Gammaproteobacteria bacterium]
MKPAHRRVSVMPILLALAALTTAGAAPAAAPAKAVLQIEGAWIRWLPADLPAAAYAVIVNHGDANARLIGADSPDYGMLMLHRSLLAQGSSSMEAVSGLEIPAQGEAALAPGGYHLMLTEPQHAIKPGDTVKITLHFADGIALQADFPVRPANASGP